MISITTATADDLITLADIEQICFSSQESASLNTLNPDLMYFLIIS